VHVPRRMKEHHQLVSDVTEQLSHALGRSPTTQEIADRAGITVEEVLEALEVGGCYRGVPLAIGDDDSPTNDDSPIVGQDDRGYGAAEARLAITSVIHQLPARDRYILKLRFVDRLTQTQIGERVGVSQVQVSRLIQASLAKLREQLGAPTP
jgi:RNA polymerase sigma-B factor